MSHTTNIRTTRFFHNSDFSGDVTIVRDGKQFKVPGEDLIDLVSRYWCETLKKSMLDRTVGPIHGLNIPAEGFTFKHKEGGNSNIAFTSEYDDNPRRHKDWFMDVIYNPNNNWVLICQGDRETPYSDWDTMFAGQVNTQEELKMILKMVKQ